MTLCVRSDERPHVLWVVFAPLVRMLSAVMMNASLLGMVMLVLWCMGLQSNRDMRFLW